MTVAKPLGTYTTIASLGHKIEALLRSGIRGPKYCELRPPFKLARFVDRQRGKAGGMVSPWWIEDVDLLKIVAAREHSVRVHGGDLSRALSLGFMARWANAVPQEWQKGGQPGHATTMDMLLQGSLRVPIDAFVGRGETQTEKSPNGINVMWTGWPSITQIFIPAFCGATISDVDSIISVDAPTEIESGQLYKR